MTESSSRRDLMKPAQLLGLAFIAALFAGGVTLVAMGAFQARPAEDVQRAILTALVVAGITFIVTLVVMALLVLAIDPAEIQKPLERPVLLPPEADSGAGSGTGTGTGSGSGSGTGTGTGGVPGSGKGSGSGTDGVPGSGPTAH